MKLHLIWFNTESNICENPMIKDLMWLLFKSFTPQPVAGDGNDGHQTLTFPYTFSGG